MTVKARRHQINRLAREDSGAALIEMAVVFPILLTIGLGVIEFSNYFFQLHLVANGVRDGARYASGIMGDICTDTALQGRAKNIAVYGQTPAGTASARVIGWTTADVTVACTATNNSSFYYRGGTTINSVTVTASVAYNSLGFLGYLTTSVPRLSFSQEERVIGVR